MFVKQGTWATGTKNVRATPALKITVTVWLAVPRTRSKNLVSNVCALKDTGEMAEIVSNRTHVQNVTKTPFAMKMNFASARKASSEMGSSAENLRLVQ